jgi:hypothetical protein
VTEAAMAVSATALAGVAAAPSPKKTPPAATLPAMVNSFALPLRTRMAPTLRRQPELPVKAG